MGESRQPWVEAFVAHQFTARHSGSGDSSLPPYLREHGIPALHEIDTRSLVRRLRERGAMRGVVTSERSDVAALVAEVRDSPPMEGRALVDEVTCAERYTLLPKGDPRFRLAVYDYGIKTNILRSLLAEGAALEVLPARTPASVVRDLGVDGVVLSNGPGDPEPLHEMIAAVRDLVDGDYPVLGICLGHQLLGLALGAKTSKLKFGHHGGNQPVKDLATGVVAITSQNHGFMVDPDSLPAGVHVTQVNLNDGTVEGLAVDGRPVFSVQYHPEAAPGPRDAHPLFRAIPRSRDVGVAVAARAHRCELAGHHPGLALRARASQRAPQRHRARRAALDLDRRHHHGGGDGADDRLQRGPPAQADRRQRGRRRLRARPQPDHGRAAGRDRRAARRHRRSRRWLTARARSRRSTIPRPLDVTLRGVDPRGWPGGVRTSAGQPRDDGIPTVQLGRELERRLGVAEGDVLRLVAVDLEDLSFRYRKVRNGKSFETGFAEADSGWVMIDRALVEEMGGKSSLLEIGVADPLETAAITKAVQDILGDEFLVTDWRQFNRELFTALRLQKVALFLVLGLIVVVATFNVASTLVVLARERRREVGVLKAMGLDPRSLTAVFLLCGLALGGAGAVLGVAVGWLVSWALTTFELIQFDPGVAAIYFISSVPFRVEIDDVLAILGFGLVATLVACWIPAWRGAALNPSEALRYD